MADLSALIKIAVIEEGSTDYSVNNLAAVTPKLKKINPNDIKIVKECANKLKVVLDTATVATTLTITDDTGVDFTFTTSSAAVATRKSELMAAINVAGTGFIAFEAVTTTAGTFYIKAVSGTGIAVLLAQNNITVTNVQLIITCYDEQAKILIDYLVDSLGIGSATDATVLNTPAAEATLANLITASGTSVDGSIQALQLFSDLNSPSNGLYSINGSILLTDKQLPALAADGIRGVRVVLNKKSIVVETKNPNAITVTVTAADLTTTVVVDDGTKNVTFTDNSPAATKAVADIVLSMVNQINSSGVILVATNATSTTFDIQSSILATIAIVGTPVNATTADAPTKATLTVMKYNLGERNHAKHAELVVL